MSGHINVPTKVEVSFLVPGAGPMKETMLIRLTPKDATGS